jgi:hypothetical protein
VHHNDKRKRCVKEGFEGIRMAETKDKEQIQAEAYVAMLKEEFKPKKLDVLTQINYYNFETPKGVIQKIESIKRYIHDQDKNIYARIDVEPYFVDQKKRTAIGAQPVMVLNNKRDRELIKLANRFNKRYKKEFGQEWIIQ